MEIDPEFVKQWVAKWIKEHPGQFSSCNQGKCRRKKKWIRHTQFSGKHRYCDSARLEKNFGKNDPSYFYWEEI
jgi:hypothetical protein